MKIGEHINSWIFRNFFQILLDLLFHFNLDLTNGVVPHCPSEKEEAIKDALRRFRKV